MKKLNQIILNRENGGGVEHSFLNLSFLLYDLAFAKCI